MACGPARRCPGLPVPGLQGPTFEHIGESGDGPGPEKAFLLSAALPGAGQYVQGQRRWIVYATAELAGWILVLERRHDGARLRDRYRELAWSVAREGLSEGPRMDGDFEYYETLSHWVQSGRFDLDPVLEGIQPETDPGTFNGSIWSRARDIYFPEGAPEPREGDPIYEEALAYYRARAYPARFLWDWSPDPSAWAAYDRTIEASDDRFRQVTLLTGALMANHLLSGVDAFVSARLRQASGASVSVTSGFGPGIRAAPRSFRFELTVHWRPATP